MPQLDNLLSKIETNGEASANEIIKKAEDEAALLLDDARKEAEARKEEILLATESEALHLKETILSGKRLGVRDDILHVKLKTIERVFKKAISIMSSMSLEEYEEFVEKTLLESHIGKEGFLQVPEKFASIDIDKVSKNSNTTLRLSDKYVSNGFIFECEGIEYNNTFDALLSFNQDDLELFVSRELF